MLRRFSCLLTAVTLAVGTTTMPVQADEANQPEQVQSQTVTRSQGEIKAVLSFDRVSKPWTQYRNVRLKITRGDQVAYAENLFDNAATKALKEFWVMADERFQDTSPHRFVIRDLDGDREPEILLGFYSGGAHCCVSSAIYRYDADQKAYQPTVVNWGDAAATFTLRRLDPQRPAVQFVSLDAGFAYAFSAYAFSGFPIQIWEYRQGQMVDVTRQYPKLIYNSAYANWLQIQQVQRRYPDEPQFARGPIAAYMATKYLLGQEKSGWALMDQVYQGKDKAKFFANLRQFLVRTGYAKS